MGSGTEPRGLGEIVVSSRPYDEYLAMFGLSEADALRGPVLDCPAGAGAFGVEVRERGGEVVSVDPAYRLGVDEIVAQSRAGLDRGLRYLEENRGSYVWTFFRSPEEFRRRRDEALESFTEQFRGPDAHHVIALLPDLPFPDRRFRLALCGYLLFSYPDHFDEAQHLEGLRELCRVAREEVRLYPLIDTAYERYAGIDDLRSALVADEVDSEIRDVDYEFQDGAGEVLVLRPPER